MDRGGIQIARLPSQLARHVGMGSAMHERTPETMSVIGIYSSFIGYLQNAHRSDHAHTCGRYEMGIVIDLRCAYVSKLIIMFRERKREGIVEMDQEALSANK